MSHDDTIIKVFPDGATEVIQPGLFYAPPAVHDPVKDLLRQMTEEFFAQQRMKELEAEKGPMQTFRFMGETVQGWKTPADEYTPEELEVLQAARIENDRQALEVRRSRSSLEAQSLRHRMVKAIGLLSTIQAAGVLEAHGHDDLNECLEEALGALVGRKE